MEVLCFSPARSPILHPKFTGKEAIKSSSFAAVRRSSRRLKPLIYTKVSKPLKASNSSAAKADDNPPQYPYEKLQYEVGKLIPNNDKCKNVTLNPVQDLSKILLSKVYDVASVSPLKEAELLYNEDEGVHYWVKRDDMQSVFSFKLRGAYNLMSKLTPEQLKKGVIAASAGNHAQGVALAGQKLNCVSNIVMPEHASVIKRQAVERLGGTIDLHGETLDEAVERAKKRSEEEGLVLIKSDDQELIAGQGTIAMEIVQQLRQLKEEPYAIFVPIGGGALLSGTAAYVRAILPNVKIIGVEPSGACAMALSFQLGERVKLKSTNTIADGVAVAVIGPGTYNVSKQLVDGIVIVEDTHIAAAIKDVFDESRTILEPSGALALAGAKAYCRHESQKDLVKGKSIIAVATGANMDFEKLKDIVDMANVGNQREAVLASFLPEQPGSFKLFCELVGSLNITEFKYRYDSSKEKALLQYSVAYSSQAELDALVGRLDAAQLLTVNVSDQQLVLRHLRHMVGGQSKVENELLCRVTLPDKPRAFLEFLNALNPSWNITMVHYRIEGSLDANVLVGIQVVESEMEEFHERVKSFGHPYKLYSKNPALQQLIG